MSELTATAFIGAVQNNNTAPHAFGTGQDSQALYSAANGIALHALNMVKKRLGKIM